MTLGGYVGVLGRLYGFWRGWEPQVAAVLLDEALLAPRRRLHLLAADLKAAGVCDADVAALPACPPPVLDSAAEALGSLYVMEGSTLGGRVIQRHVERCLGEAGRAACSYFGGYGAQTGAMWRAFLARLDTVPAEDGERVGRGATATFERVGWWLDPGTIRP